MDDGDYMHEPAVKEGYALNCYPVRWKAYKPGAPTKKKGRWQRMNEYGGWDNCEKPDAVLSEPVYATRIAELEAERDEAVEAHGALWRTLATIIECPGVSPNATVRRMAALAERALIDDKLSAFKPEPRFARLEAREVEG
jgi:hypothetical protein